MAYFQRRRGAQVTIYYWDTREGRAVPLPREQTRHLDDQDDDAVRAWMYDWEQEHGRETNRVLRHHLGPTDDASRLFEAAIEEWKARRPKRAQVLEEYRGHLALAAEYFVGVHGRKDVRKWAPHTVELPAWLHGLTREKTTRDGRRVTVKRFEAGTVKKVCQTVNRFGRYLARHRVIAQPWLIEAPSTGVPVESPLRKLLLQEDVMEAARKLEAAGHADWALIVMLGFFGGMRPEEVFALGKEDFLTGDMAVERVKTWKRFQEKGLGSRLSVTVDKTLTGAEVSRLMKTSYSAGVVNIWWAPAAREIARLLRDRRPGRIVDAPRWKMDKLYAKIAFPVVGVTAKDLQRACGACFELIGIDPRVAQRHFRHSSYSTTLRYMRLPPSLLREAMARRSGGQDFGDVG